MARRNAARGLRTAWLALGVGCLALLGPAQAGAQEEEDPCAGRNPLYCGTVVPGEDGASVVLAPPGGCEGRNPLYCREEEEPALEPEPERRRKRGRNPRSRNPNRNPAQGGGGAGS